MRTFQKHNVIVLILLGGFVLLPRCMSTQPENQSNSRPSPNPGKTESPESTLHLASATYTRLPEAQSPSPRSSPTFPSPIVSNTLTPEPSQTAIVSPEPLPLGWLAFSSSATDLNMRINIVRTDGLGLRTIAGTGSLFDKTRYPAGPRWSPDGRWIAFVGGSHSTNIYVVRSDGSDFKRLTFSGNITYITGHAWSPDGKRFLYSQRIKTGERLQAANPNDLFIYDLERSRIQQLTDTPDISENLPEYLSDGKRISFFTTVHSDEGIRSNFHIMDLGGTQQKVIEFPFLVYDYGWSPDDDQIVIVGGKWPPKGFGCNNLYLANIEDGNFYQLTTDSQWYQSPAFSPDGKWIAYIKAACNAPAAPGSYQIGIMRLDGGQEMFLPDYQEGEENNVSWSPWSALQTGKRFLITTGGDGLKLRSEPSSNAQVYDWLKEGTEILILDGPLEADEYLWWYVRVDDSEKEGWIAELPGWFELP